MHGGLSAVLSLESQSIDEGGPQISRWKGLRNDYTGLTSLTEIKYLKNSNTNLHLGISGNTSPFLVWHETLDNLQTFSS